MESQESLGSGAGAGRLRVSKPRRPRVNVERAQEASQRLIAGACRDLGWLWNRQEALLAQAHARSEATEAARPLIEVCMTCPIVTECGIWASADSYCGVAAGVVWHEGQVRPQSWTVPTERFDEAS